MNIRGRIHNMRTTATLKTGSNTQKSLGDSREQLPPFKTCDKIIIMINNTTQSAGIREYTDCISAYV